MITLFDENFMQIKSMGRNKECIFMWWNPVDLHFVQFNIFAGTSTLALLPHNYLFVLNVLITCKNYILIIINKIKYFKFETWYLKGHWTTSSSSPDFFFFFKKSWDFCTCRIACTLVTACLILLATSSQLQRYVYDCFLSVAIVLKSTS